MGTGWPRAGFALSAVFAQFRDQWTRMVERMSESRLDEPRQFVMARMLDLSVPRTREHILADMREIPVFVEGKLGARRGALGQITGHELQRWRHGKSRPSTFRRRGRSRFNKAPPGSVGSRNQPGNLWPFANRKPSTPRFPPTKAHAAMEAMVSEPHGRDGGGEGRMFPENRKEEGEKAAAYFTTRKERMDYSVYRAKGAFIGSGVVDAACKTVVVARFKGSGMHGS